MKQAPNSQEGAEKAVDKAILQTVQGLNPEEYPCSIPYLESAGCILPVSLLNLVPSRLSRMQTLSIG